MTERMTIAIHLYAALITPATPERDGPEIARRALAHADALIAAEKADLKASIESTDRAYRAARQPHQTTNASPDDATRALAPSPPLPRRPVPHDEPPTH